MKQHFFFLQVFSIALILFSQISLKAQNDTTNDSWTMNGSRAYTTDKVSIGGSVGITDFDLFASAPTEGIRVENGRIGFGNSSIWQPFLTAKNTGNAHLHDLEFWTTHGGWGSASSVKMVLDSQGKLGIGTTLPYSRLHVIGQTSPYIQPQNLWPAILARGGVSFGAAGNDNPGCWISTYNDANNNNIVDESSDNSVLGNSATMAFYSTVNTGGATQTPHMVIAGSAPNLKHGYIGMGTTNPQHKLDVCGTGRFKEVIVEEGWCDYVFEEDYCLPSLEEEQKYVVDKGHLLGFESAEVMNGEIKMGDVTKRQQQKIEEIMLHLFEMDKKIHALQEENSTLKMALESK